MNLFIQAVNFPRWASSSLFLLQSNCKLILWGWSGVRRKAFKIPSSFLRKQFLLVHCSPLDRMWILNSYKVEAYVFQKSVTFYLFIFLLLNQGKPRGCLIIYSWCCVVGALCSQIASFSRLIVILVIKLLEIRQNQLKDRFGRISI